MERLKASEMQSIVKEGVPALQSVEAQWVKVKLVMAGHGCPVQVGDYSEVILFAGLLRKKMEVALGFVEGECAIGSVFID